MKKNILLTGASGTLGFEVLKQLVEKNHYKITVFDIRNKNSEKKFSSIKGDFEIVYGDISSKNDVEKISKNKDAVIHLAAIIPPLADEKPELAEKVNVKGTENLILALEKNSPDTFFIYSSSISVYGDRIENPDIFVNDPLIPSEGDEYAFTKIKTEQLIQNSKLNWTIFRLAAIMGNHKISKLMFNMPLETSVEICTPEDTARAFVNTIEKQNELKIRIFNLGGGETCRLSYKDLLSESFRIFGMGKVDFPEKAFAEKNFHCGNYADGDDLEEILHFRKDDLEAYFRKVKSGVNPAVKIITKLVNPLVKKRLLKESEPYESFKTGDQKMMERFFN